MLRAELADSPADFCVKRGFEEVTVDEIAQAIGISRATFFRHFTSKEDAVVVSIRVGRVSVAEQLRAAPPTQGIRAVDAVREVMVPTVEVARRNRDVFRARLQMIADSPALRAHLASERSEQRDVLERTLTELLSDPIAARAVAHASMAAIDLTWSLWQESENADFGDLLDSSFEFIVDIGAVRIA